MENSIFKVASDIVAYTVQTIEADGIYLFMSILVAVAMTVYIDPKKTRALFLKQNKFLMSGSIGLGAFTPLCACGTMAVVISLLTTALPWGPIMAFLVSSPLMSPDTFILISGFMGTYFAIILTVASVILGLMAGYLTILIDKKTKFLKNQFRVSTKVQPKTNYAVNTTNIIGFQKKSVQNLKVYKNCCSTLNLDNTASKHSAKNAIQNFIIKIKLYEFLKQLYNIGVKKIIPLFLLFVIIAYIVKTYVPTEWIITLFSGNNIFSVPIAAIIGLPLYVSDATIAPLLQVLKEGGASQGSLLAFMIAGPGTSLAVIIGLNIVLKKKAILLYTLYIFLGAIILGYSYDFVLLFV